MICIACAIQQKGIRPADYIYEGNSLCEEHFAEAAEIGTKPRELAKPKSKRGARLPEGYAPPNDVIQAMMSELGVEYQALGREHRKFCDYWYAQPGQKGVKLDWDATWRNWMRRAGEQGSLGIVRQSTVDSGVEDAIARGQRLARESAGADDSERGEDRDSLPSGGEDQGVRLQLPG